ncbi:hypothetical protein [Fictibacillus phosphorivorans]|uniref:hypothetical protein n=1 Tax=Fictibacillus phosphorivorans TaxID=1221500 RepID=UPI0020411FB3|nr:hypothetical protein [Fictibacillus phosphorivorans]MCM3719258.1 hypothetical protein [Fictibacillus phosphorivorans]MCM3776880.1 hypothetical protein [Fictibacillus phosphorivorans]
MCLKNELMATFNRGEITEKELKVVLQTAEDLISNYKNREFDDITICEKHATEWLQEKKFTK